jgi:hypothetical protein
MRYSDSHVFRYTVANHIHAPNGQRVDAPREIAGALGPEVHCKIIDNFPIRERVAITKAIDWLITPYLDYLTEKCFIAVIRHRSGYGYRYHYNGPQISDS